MTTVHWIAGISRVGKATLIARLRMSVVLRERLGMVGSFHIFERSLDVDRPEKGNWPVEDLVTELGKADNIIVKWQYVHDEGGYISLLKARAPDVRQRIILVERDVEQILATCSDRPYQEARLRAEHQLLPIFVDGWMRNGYEVQRYQPSDD